MPHHLFFSLLGFRREDEADNLQVISREPSGFEIDAREDWTQEEARDVQDEGELISRGFEDGGSDVFVREYGEEFYERNGELDGDLVDRDLGDLQELD